MMQVAGQSGGKADIILMYPKTGLDIGGHTVAPPHSILAVAAPVHKAGYRVKIIDMRRDPNWAATLAQSLCSDTICIGISTMTGTQIYFALMMAEEARRLTDGRVPIVWGGPHPSILPEQTLQDERVDMVVVGEGEETFLELVEALEHHRPLDGILGLGYKDGGRIQVNPPRPLLDVNTLLPVPWELIDVEKYINPDNYFLKDSPRTLDIGQTSRGCPRRCGFCCASSILEKRWRPMTVERALEAILEPVRRFNLTGVWIRDDEFYVKNDRAFAICERIVNSPYDIRWYATGSRVDDFNRATDEQLELIKLSGGRIMKFGAESGNDRILDLIQKGFHVEDTLRANQRCKQHGIVPAYSFDYWLSHRDHRGDQQHHRLRLPVEAREPRRPTGDLPHVHGLSGHAHVPPGTGTRAAPAREPAGMDRLDPGRLRHGGPADPLVQRPPAALDRKHLLHEHPRQRRGQHPGRHPQPFLAGHVQDGPGLPSGLLPLPAAAQDVQDSPGTAHRTLPAEEDLLSVHLHDRVRRAGFAMSNPNLAKLAAINAAKASAPKSTLSVVLSFRNEEEVLEELIRRLRTVLDGLIQQGRLTDYELIFVNDDSTDRSEEVLERAAQGHRDIKVINMSRNFGVSVCVMAGMEFASGDAVVYMDADLQDPPEVIPQLVEAWQDRNADVVHTVRVVRAGESRFKLWLTALGYRIIRYVSEVELPIEAGDFKLLSRRAVDHLVQLREKQPYLRGLACWIGFNQEKIEYRREPRAAGKTKFPVFGRKVIRNFLNSALIAFSGIPLQLALLGGFVVSGIAFCLLVYVVLQKIFGNPTTGWSALMVTMLFLGGIQLLTIGILGLYLNSVYLETKGRPNYIIESSRGFEHELRRSRPGERSSGEAPQQSPDAQAPPGQEPDRGTERPALERQ